MQQSPGKGRQNRNNQQSPQAQQKGRNPRGADEATSGHKRPHQVDALLPVKKQLRVAENEWAAIGKTKVVPGRRVCKFWNLSCGCKFENDCKDRHICYSCGGDHKWCDRHFSK